MSNVDKLLLYHSHRSNFLPLAFLALSGVFIGHMIFYIDYKITVIEKKWAGNYGADYPHFVSRRYSQFI